MLPTCPSLQGGVSFCPSWGPGEEPGEGVTVWAQSPQSPQINSRGVELGTVGVKSLTWL